eukprot:GDKJ01023862.1.p1 GENE.GDKJ01023862.1~~GDKJ01023862.1.p1  ORF type:complete len:958 (+),score=255.37 GDKJ01023862.1:3-2876(+)
MIESICRTFILTHMELLKRQESLDPVFSPSKKEDASLEDIMCCVAADKTALQQKQRISDWEGSEKAFMEKNEFLLSNDNAYPQFVRHLFKEPTIISLQNLLFNSLYMNNNNNEHLEYVDNNLLDSQALFESQDANNHLPKEAAGPASKTKHDPTISSRAPPTPNSVNKVRNNNASTAPASPQLVAKLNSAGMNNENARSPRLSFPPICSSSKILSPPKQPQMLSEPPFTFEESQHNFNAFNSSQQNSEGEEDDDEKSEEEFDFEEHLDDCSEEDEKLSETKAAFQTSHDSRLVVTTTDPLHQPDQTKKNRSFNPQHVPVVNLLKPQGALIPPPLPSALHSNFNQPFLLPSSSASSCQPSPFSQTRSLMPNQLSNRNTIISRKVIDVPLINPPSSPKRSPEAHNILQKRRESDAESVDSSSIMKRLSTSVGEKSSNPKININFTSLQRVNATSASATPPGDVSRQRSFAVSSNRHTPLFAASSKLTSTPNLDAPPPPSRNVSTTMSSSLYLQLPTPSSSLQVSGTASWPVVPALELLIVDDDAMNRFIIAGLLSMKTPSAANHSSNVFKNKLNTTLSVVQDGVYDEQTLLSKPKFKVSTKYAHSGVAAVTALELVEVRIEQEVESERSAVRNFVESVSEKMTSKFSPSQIISRQRYNALVREMVNVFSSSWAGAISSGTIPIAKSVLVITDLNMKDGDGPFVGKAVKALKSKLESKIGPFPSQSQTNFVSFTKILASSSDVNNNSNNNNNNSNSKSIPQDVPPSDLLPRQGNSAESILSRKAKSNTQDSEGIKGSRSCSPLEPKPIGSPKVVCILSSAQPESYVARLIGNENMQMFDGYLEKPVQVDILTEYVSRVADYRLEREKLLKLYAWTLFFTSSMKIFAVPCDYVPSSLLKHQDTCSFAENDKAKGSSPKSSFQDKKNRLNDKNKAETHKLVDEVVSPGAVSNARKALLQLES